MSTNDYRKCAKCGRTRAEDKFVSYHRFPNPGKNNMTKALAWAKYCWPNEDWTHASLIALHNKNKVLCGRHFALSQFYDNMRQKLSKFAFPDSAEVQELINKRENIFKPDVAESCADAGDSGPRDEQEVENTDICDDVHDDNDNSDTLVESNVCRVCLALDVKMYDLKDIELRKMFQNITGIAFTENNHSILERLCWECAGRLKAAAAFRNKALLSDALLQGLAYSGEQIRKNYIALIKENEDYLKSAGALSIVEVFHTVEIDPEYESVPPLSDNNDTEIVQNTVRKDSIELEESIIEVDTDQMDIEDESIIEAPIETEIVYDHICPNNVQEKSNIFIIANPVVSNNITFREDNISSAHSSSPLPGCSHVEQNYSIPRYLSKTPSNCEDKIQKPVIKITKRDLISRIVLKNSKELISHHTLIDDAKFNNTNLKICGISKKDFKSKTGEEDSS